VTVAKTQANHGNEEAANQTLQMAFNACLAAANSGATFFIVFGHVALQAILEPEFIAPIRPPTSFRSWLSRSHSPPCVMSISRK
jgi:hypothetical protein